MAAAQRERRILTVPGHTRHHENAADSTSAAGLLASPPSFPAGLACSEGRDGARGRSRAAWAVQILTEPRLVGTSPYVAHFTQQTTASARTPAPECGSRYLHSHGKHHWRLGS